MANRAFQEYSMVNNAGIGGTENHGMVHEMSEQTWDNVMGTNSRSVFLGCKYACAQFLDQAPHSTGHRGWIINTSSIMGLVGQAVNGGMVDRSFCPRPPLNTSCSRLLRIKRCGDPSDEAGRCRVRKTQDPLQLHMSRT